MHSRDPALSRSYCSQLFPRSCNLLSGGERRDLDHIALKEAEVLDASNTENIANLIIISR